MRWSLLAVLLIGASPIRAQEVPSPPALDSILELVQSPSDHRGHDAVVLMEDSYFKLHADGRVTRTTRQIAQILTAAGAEEWGEYSFQYNSIRDRARLDWMRVIEDGEVVQNGPSHQQTSKVSADQSSPVYSDMAVLQATLARVRPGAIVDYSFTVETVDPQQPGDFRGSWLLNGLFPVIRSRLVVDAPETMSIRVKDRAEGADHSEEAVGDRRLRTWTATDLEAIEVEPFAAMPSRTMMTVEVGPAVEWSDVGSWYEQFLPRQPVVSEALELAHETVVADAATLRDSLSATYRWIAQDFRYVSLSLGDGGYRARSPHEVFETGFGDCKDKTMLFVALADHMGVEAAPVLVHSEGEVDADLPSLTQFDHMIARVEHDGITSFVDLTAPVVPYGETPGNLEGSSGLVVALDGTTDFVTLPASEPSENTFSSFIEGTLDTENRFVGSVTYSATGSEQYWLRSQFYGIDEFDDRSREELLRGIAESVWESASVDSSRVFDGRDLDSPAAVTVWFTVIDVMGVAGERLLLNLPIPGYADPSLLATLEADDERLFPIDAEQVNSPSVYRHRAEIHVPPRWVAELPADVAVEGDFGYYRAHFEQTDRTIVLEREMGGVRGLAPPDKAPELIAWVESVSEDDASYLLINPSGSVTESATGDELALADVLIGIDDLGDGATWIGDGASSTLELDGMASGETLRTHTHDFVTEGTGFHVGESRLVTLSVSAAEYNTRIEAEKDLRTFDLIAGEALFGQMSVGLGDQMSIAGAEELELPEAGAFSKAWLVELATSLASLDVVVASLARGRVAVTLWAIGPEGVRRDDVDSLLVLMGERIVADPLLTEDRPMEPIRTTSTLDSSAVMEEADGFRMERMLLGPHDLPGMRIASDELDNEGFHTLVQRRLSSIGYTSDFGRSRLMDVEVDVVLTDSEGRALKRVVEAREVDERDFADEAGDSEDMEWIPGMTIEDWDRDRDPDFPSPAVTAVGAPDLVDVEMGVAIFAVGRFLVRLRTVSPKDQLETDDLLQLAGRVRDRVIANAAEAVDFQADREDVREVERLLEVEEEAARLYRADEFEDFVALVEREHRPEGLATFEPWVWNNVCWSGALAGRAEEVLYACDLALSQTERVSTYRDSRGLARALSGDLDGAISDFEYVLEYGNDQLKETRAPFLQALERGENPFTEEVLQTLRDEG